MGTINLRNSLFGYNKDDVFNYIKALNDKADKTKSELNEKINSLEGNISGLKNESEFEPCSDMYQLTTQVIEEKSDFASTLLFLTHAKGLNWKTPAYIWEGLAWLQKQTH